MSMGEQWDLKASALRLQQLQEGLEGLLSEMGSAGP